MLCNNYGPAGAISKEIILLSLQSERKKKGKRMAISFNNTNDKDFHCCSKSKKSK